MARAIIDGGGRVGFLAVDAAVIVTVGRPSCDAHRHFTRLRFDKPPTSPHFPSDFLLDGRLLRLWAASPNMPTVLRYEPIAAIISFRPSGSIGTMIPFIYSRLSGAVLPTGMTRAITRLSGAVLPRGMTRAITVIDFGGGVGAVVVVTLHVAVTSLAIAHVP